MNELIEIFQNNENWLIKRVLYYAKTLGYTKYFSTLEKSLPQSIKELTTLLIEGLKNFKEIPQITPDEDLEKNSLTSFGIKEASKHKIRGITLAHFIGLFKYYKQSYIDLVTANNSFPQIDKIRLFIERSFDRIEIGICREWTKPDNDEHISELRSMNRLLTNEKNNYLTMFASLAEPAIMINKSHEILNLNDAAVKIFDAEKLSESQSFHNQKQYSQDENETRHFLVGKQIFDVFPWLTVPLKKMHKQKNTINNIECSVELKGEQKFYDINFTKIPDVGEKFTGDIVILRDITEFKKMQKTLIDTEGKLSSVIRVTPTGIGVVVDRVIKNVNKRLCDMTGYNSKELLNKSSRILYSDQEEYDRVGSDKYSQISKYGSGSIETRFSRKDGKIIDVLLNFTPIDKTNLSLGVTFTALDITEQKIANEALKESEKRYRLIIENMSDYIYSAMIDRKGNIKTEWITGALESITGYTFKEIQNFENGYMAILAQNDLQNILKIIPFLLKNKPHLIEYRINTKKGEIRWLRDYIKPVWDEKQNRVVRLLGAVQDITARKNAEEELINKEQNLRSLINAITMIAFLIENDGTILAINAATIRSLGIKNIDVIGKNIYNFIPPENASYRKSKAKQVISTGKPLQFDDVRAGRYYHNSVYPILEANGNVVRLAIFSFEFTDQKSAEDALQASQKMLRSILDTIPVRVFWKDRDSIYMGSNLLFAQDAGYVSPEEIIGKNDFQMAWRSDAEKFIIEDKQVITTDRTKLDFEITRTMPDGNKRWFKSCKIPMKDQKGNIIGILGCYEDITNHKLTVEALKESEAQYRSLFEDSPISLWEEDFSEVKKILDNLILNGVTDLEKHLVKHPEIVKLCTRSIKVLNINQATVNIYKAQNKKELFTKLENIFTDDTFEMFRKELVAFVKGQTSYKGETVLNNSKGEEIWAVVNVIIAPGYEKTWSKVFVSVIDITERKLAEEALRESEQKYRVLFENASDGILIMKGEKFLDCNPKILDIFKCTREQIIGKTPYELSPNVQPDGKKSKEKAYEFIKAVEAGKSQIFEWVHTRPNNTEFNVEVSLTTFKLENQNLILAVLRDITERKLVEKTLRFTQFSIDHAGDAAFWMGPDAHFVYVNETACRSLGYSKEELLDMVVFDVDPNFNNKNWKPHWKDIEKKQSFTIESVHKKKNGELFPVEITINYVNFMGSKYNCAFSRDISERKSAEKAIRDSEKRYRTLFETMKQGVVYQNDQGEIISANPAAEEILGLSQEQMYGLTSYNPNWKAIHEDGSPFPGDTHPGIIALKNGYEIKNVVMGIFNPKENKYHWINVNSIPQFDEKGKPFQVYSTFGDITERKLTEDKLRNYAQTQQVLLQEVNHRVKNNLAAIISMLHKEEDRAVSKGFSDHLPILQNLERRVNGLLTVHSILSSIKWQPIELNQLCEKVISNALQGSQLQKNINLKVEQSPIKINSNLAHYLTIVLNELATNSLKHALQDRDSANININFKESKKYVILYFKDDGPGFPDKILKDCKNESNIGFELIHGIIYHSLGGKFELYNDNGAVVKIHFINETDFPHEESIK